jgi:small nuclear ribonucleoprotein
MTVENINLIKPVCDARSQPVQIETMSADMAIEVLKTSVGKVVLIKLKGGKVIRGSLQGFDQHMNLSLEAAEEIVTDGKSTSLGTLIVRGDNIIMISPPPG